MHVLSVLSTTVAAPPVAVGAPFGVHPPVNLTNSLGEVAVAVNVTEAFTAYFVAVHVTAVVPFKRQAILPSLLVTAPTTAGGVGAAEGAGNISTVKVSLTILGHCAA